MTCPTCSSPRVYPSRLRGAGERFWQMLTEKQPHRCHECGWRAWRTVHIANNTPDVSPDDLRTGLVMEPVSATDLDSLDSAPTA